MTLLMTGNHPSYSGIRQENKMRSCHTKDFVAGLIFLLVVYGSFLL
jgi:hypothetical protein